MPPHTNVSRSLVVAAQELSRQISRLKFPAPASFVYNPLDYAWSAHESYLQKFGRQPKKVVFVGMNPGPFGMAQTGVPFGEIAAVRDWMGIHAEIGKPAREHPKRPVTGFACTRSEVSGQRLWGLFAKKFGPPEAFFQENFVTNYCPLLFCEASGRNLTPDKLPARTQAKLFALCDAHLFAQLKALQPEWVIGIGAFAAKRGQITASQIGAKSGQILHPSPASPAANRGWADLATRELNQLGVWR